MQTYEQHIQLHTSPRSRWALSLGALVFLLGAGACKSSSVVSENTGNNPPAPIATASAPAPEASVAPTADASPAAAMTSSPTAPVPSATTMMTTANATLLANNPNAPKAQGGQSTGGTMRRIGDFPIEVGPAKVATPAPEPFKPRPTPTLVLENGRIKQQWAAPAEAASQTNPLKNKPDAVKLGRELYLQRCADCHGRGGKGNGYMSAQLKRDGQPITPTNLTSQMVQANTDGELFWKITKGRSPMPASGVRFSDEERWAIVSFLRTLK